MDCIKGETTMIYFYSGRPGSGKSLHCAKMIDQYHRKGKNVICNFEVNENFWKRKHCKKNKFLNDYGIIQELSNEQLTIDFLMDFANKNHKRNNLLTPQLAPNNYLYVSPCKKGKKKKFYIHRLVAEVWCQKPDFEIPNCPLQVHHKLKVLRNSTIDVNFAMNLEYLYRPHHKAIEHITSYQVQRPTGKWFYLPDVHAIAEYYNTSTYSIYQLLTHSPKEIKGNYEIYESDNIKIKVGKEK